MKLGDFEELGWHLLDDTCTAFSAFQMLGETLLLTHL